MLHILKKRNDQTLMKLCFFCEMEKFHIFFTGSPKFGHFFTLKYS